MLPVSGYFKGYYVLQVFLNWCHREGKRAEEQEVLEDGFGVLVSCDEADIWQAFMQGRGGGEGVWWRRGGG